MVAEYHNANSRFTCTGTPQKKRSNNEPNIGESHRQLLQIKFPIKNLLAIYSSQGINNPNLLTLMGKRKFSWATLSGGLDETSSVFPKLFFLRILFEWCDSCWSWLFAKLTISSSPASSSPASSDILLAPFGPPSKLFNQSRIFNQTSHELESFVIYQTLSTSKEETGSKIYKQSFDISVM